MVIYEFELEKIIEISIISLPSLDILTRLYTGRLFLIDYIEISTKIHQNNTNYTHQKIEPIKAGFSTNDRLGFTGPAYSVDRLLPYGFNLSCRGMGYNIL